MEDLFEISLLCMSLSLSAVLLLRCCGKRHCPASPEEMGTTHLDQIDPAVRAKWIDELIAFAETEYKKTGGRLQSAHYSDDIYVCKNFTVHLFKNTASKYRMLAYPRVRLSVPNNKSREECAPYSYGIEWEYKPASEGNPFFTAASFRYDETLSEEENRTNAIIFMTNVKKVITSRCRRNMSTAGVRTVWSLFRITTRPPISSTGQIPT